ncbi:MAG: GTPase Era [Desulfobacteraceae bacterium]|jgi:GTP-binding protein Era
MTDSKQNKPTHHSGFITIIGAPNAGKSTLLNRMLGEKISITSKKPQTTRNRILGILHRPHCQMVFLDTPGVHKANNPLNVRIVETAIAALADAEVVLLLVDASAPDPESEKILIENLKSLKCPVILALNKIDKIEKQRLLEMIDYWQHSRMFTAIVPISAKHGTQVEKLLEELHIHLPEGPPYFPADSLTDMPERFIAAEMIREKAFRQTGQEIPYAIAVTIDDFEEETSRKMVRIHATLHVERNSQKGILIGKNGSKLRQIGEDARKEIQRMVGCKVFLKLFVRVQKNWSKDTKALRRFGY